MPGGSLLCYLTLGLVWIYPSARLPVEEITLLSVSPKSGRAVSKSAAKPYEQKRLNSSFLQRQAPASGRNSGRALANRVFLRRYVLGDQVAVCQGLVETYSGPDLNHALEL